jgi:phage FluMu protein Com
MDETWLDIRCPACVKLGWDSSRLLLRARGVIAPSDAILEMKCPRCKSVIEWTLGKPILRTSKYGQKNDRPSKAVFE